MQVKQLLLTLKQFKNEIANLQHTDESLSLKVSEIEQILEDGAISEAQLEELRTSLTSDYSAADEKLSQSIQQTEQTLRDEIQSINNKLGANLFFEEI